MLRVSISVLYRRLPRVRDWPLWSLPRPLLAYLLAVICVGLAWLGMSGATFRFNGGDLLLFGALLACVAATVELTRRTSEPTGGVVKDVYAVWELPAVILLPPLYALLIPTIRLTLTQWRVRRAPVYRRVFTAAAIGIAYGCAGAVYRTIISVQGDPRAYLWSHTVIWLLAATACAVTQLAVNQALVLTAAKSADPSTRILEAFGKEPLHNDGTELCAAILVTMGLAISALTLIIALPLTTLLQRSFRHTQLLNESRADSKTGLLNAATWDREATAEVARAVRTGSALAVALLDLDRFKHINDTYGHLVGDQVLRQIADTMTVVLRDYDLAGRFGGEEFVMLLPQTRAVDAFRIAERVRAHISQLPIYAGDGTNAERVPVTVSIGVAALDAGSRRELSELLSAADAALYRAKASGRDQVQMISTSRGLSAVRPANGQSAGAGSTPPGESPLIEVAADGMADANAKGMADADKNGSSGNGASGTADHGIGKDGEAEPPAARQLPVDDSASSATTSALPV